MVLYLDLMCQCGLHAVPWSHIGYIYVPLRCRTSQYRITFIPLQMSLWNDLSDPLFESVGLMGFKSRVNAFLLALAALSQL